MFKLQCKLTFPFRIDAKIRDIKYLLNFYIFKMVFILLMYSSFLQSYILQFYFLLSIKPKCSHITILVLNMVKFSFTQKLTHKCYTKIDPQTLLKNWPTSVTQKLIHKLYSKIDPRALLKNWSTNFTQKLTHERY